MWQNFFILVVICVAVAAQFVNAAFHWTYNNIDKWPGICTEGQLQSPINLQASNALEKPFSALQFANYSLRYQATLKNNKHSVEIRLTHAQNAQLHPSVMGGSLASKFILDHMHFHWGSEHTINGHRFPLELHLVHFDSRFANIMEAKRVKGGLAVFAVLYNFSPIENEDMQQLQGLFDAISKHADKVVTLQDEIEPKYFLPCDTAGFYRYEGSLTTPGCDEVVTWTVFTNPQTISMRQVKQFEAIQSDEGPLLKNYRPLQPLNGRQILLQVSPVSSSFVMRPSMAFVSCLTLIMSQYLYEP